MPELDIAEMVCDWYARGTEFATGLRDWITNTAIDRFRIDLEGKQFIWINGFVDLLLEDSFNKEVE